MQRYEKLFSYSWIFLRCYGLRCRVCLWCYSECISKLKNLPDHGGKRTRDLWFASPMLYQLSYEVKSVRVCDISELSLLPSISVCFSLWSWFFWCYVFRCGMCLCLCVVTLSVYPHRASWKICLTTMGIEPKTFGLVSYYSDTAEFNEKCVVSSDIRIGIFGFIL